MMEPDPDADPKKNPDAKRYKSEFRRSIMGKPQGGLYDCLTTCKLPHGITILATLFVCFGTLLGLALVRNLSQLGNPVTEHRSYDLMFDGIFPCAARVGRNLGSSG